MGSWHLPPTGPRAGSALCNLSDSCAGSPHAKWHHLCLAGAAGSALARDIPWDAREGGALGGTWRHTQSICAPSVLLTGARGVPCACCPRPALHSLLPLLAPHCYSLCSAPRACSPCQSLLCCPGWRCGSRGAAGLVRTMLQSLCAQGGGLGESRGVRKAVAVCAMSVPLLGALRCSLGAWPGWGQFGGTGLALEGGCAGPSPGLGHRVGMAGGLQGPSQPPPTQLQGVRLGIYLLFLFLQNCTKRGFFFFFLI